MLAVTGASGELGGRVACRLAALGMTRRLIVHNSARAPILPGAEVVEASFYGDAAAMLRALTGVPTLFLISARDRFGVAHISAKNHMGRTSRYGALIFRGPCVMERMHSWQMHLKDGRCLLENKKTGFSIKMLQSYERVPALC